MCCASKTTYRPLVGLWRTPPRAHSSERMPERPHPVSVQQGVQRRVGVGQQNGHQCDAHGYLALRPEQQDAVDEVDGNQAHHEHEEDQEEGGGLLDFQSGSRRAGFVGLWGAVIRPGAGSPSRPPGHLPEHGGGLCLDDWS